MNKDIDIFKTALWLARQRLNMSQPEFAKHVNVAVSTISSYENGKIPSLDIAIRIFKYAGISMDKLFDIRPMDNVEEFVEVCRNIHRWNTKKDG